MRSTTVGCCAVFAAAAASLMILVSDSNAIPLNMTLDPSQSSITLNGEFQDIPLSEQGPGSTIADYTGSITVDVDNPLAPSTLQILDGSLTAGISGQWLPEAGGGPAAGDPGTAADANYGLLLEGGVLGNAYAAGRNIVFDLTSDPAAVVGGEFPSTQTLSFTSGLLVFNLPPAFMSPPGEEDQTGALLTNMATEASTYSVIGSTATLTIPIDIVDSGDFTVLYSGNLVATAVVPEPCSLALAISALAGIVALQYRRRG